jgi:phospholipase/carboxylesterase
MNTGTDIDAVEIETGTQPDASIIWLHGLGADGHDFEPLVPELRLRDELAARFIFPHAPVRPVTLNGGIPMRAWYDIVQIDRTAPQDREGIEASRELVHHLIKRENARGIRSERIVLAGFSQGGAVALHSGLRYPERLAGIIALSTYLPVSAILEAEASEGNRGLPVFMAHGTQDPVIPAALGESSYRKLSQQGYAVDWRTYPMPHAVCPPEIEHIRVWLLKLLDAGRSPELAARGKA